MRRKGTTLRAFYARYGACLAAGLVLFSAALTAGCVRRPEAALVPPMLPAIYYNCIETTPLGIREAYFDPYGSRLMAEEKYNGKVFVFKNIEVLESTLDVSGSDYLWIDSIKCRAANPGDINKLKPGQVVDIVGMMQGIADSSGQPGALLMTECFFLPAGSLALPVSGGPAFNPGY